MIQLCSGLELLSTRHPKEFLGQLNTVHFTSNKDLDEHRLSFSHTLLTLGFHPQIVN